MPRRKPAPAAPPKRSPRRPARPPAADQPAARPGPKSAAAILSADDCLRELSRLPYRLQCRLISPSEATTLRKIYVAILNQHSKSEAPQKELLPDDVIRKLFAEFPQVVSALEPLLTNAQHALIIQELRDAPE